MLVLQIVQTTNVSVEVGVVSQEVAEVAAAQEMQQAGVPLEVEVCCC